MKSFFYLTLTLSLLNGTRCAGARLLTFVGSATIDQRLVYTETHTVLLDGKGIPLEATTVYKDASGKEIEKLESDFRPSLTVPNHIQRDLRNGSIEGLRRESGTLVLYDKETDSKERVRQFDESETDGRMLVACQGLNYYLFVHRDMLQSQETVIPLRLLIPGKLDWFDFKLESVPNGRPDIAEFDVVVQNWLLRLFAPKLRLKYEKATGRLVWYNGLSNITDDNGRIQTVTITYHYEN